MTPSSPQPSEAAAPGATERRYSVNEIFYSLQGEGYFTGVPAVFLRFSGCNRHCPFCDTDHSRFTLLSAAEIVERLEQYPSRHLVATGGEPLLQLDQALVEAIAAAGFFIQVETNATLPVPDGVDWVTCSPKEEPWAIDRADEIKVVYTDGCEPDDVAERLMAHLSLFENPLPSHFMLQPCSGLNIPATVEYVKSHPHWRLSLQTHKLLNIP